MKIAILSDICANIEALEAVLQACAAEAVAEYLVLGSVVGEGPNPTECLNRLSEVAVRAQVMGCFDMHVADPTDNWSIGWSRLEGKRIIEWTRSELSEDHLELLRALPMTGIVDQFTITNASIIKPEYFIPIETQSEASDSFAVLTSQVLLYGRSYRPLCWKEHLTSKPQSIPGDKVTLGENRYLMSFGNVGLPKEPSLVAHLEKLHNKFRAFCTSTGEWALAFMEILP